MPRPTAPTRPGHRGWPALVLLLLGFSVSLGSSVLTQRWERERARLRFEQQANVVSFSLGQSLENYQEQLETLAAIMSSGRVTRAEFRTVTHPLLIGHAAIQALEWVPRVPASQRAALEAAARADGLVGFQITDRDAAGRLIPAPPQPVYYPVYYAEPQSRNLRALGHAPDLAVRRSAIERATLTGSAVASERFRLIQPDGAAEGILVFMPVYRGGEVPPDLAGRHNQLLGFVEGVFRTDELVRQAFEGLQIKDMIVQLEDVSAAPEARLLLALPPGRAPVPGELEVSSTLVMGDRTWELRVQPLSPRPVRWLTLLVLLGGMALSLSLAAYVRIVLRQREEIERLVARRTEELEELGERHAGILDAAGEGVVGMDTAGRVTFLNPAAARMLGYPLEELIGQPFHELVHHLRSDATPYPQEECPTIATLKDGAVRRISEETYWRKDGKALAVATVIAPLRQGERLVGAVLSLSDLSERKVAEAERAELLARERAARAEMENAQQLARLKTSFVDAIAHDLRTPLTSMRGYLEFLEEGLGGPLSAEQAQFVEQIGKGSARLENLVNDLLDFARLEAGTFQLTCAEEDLLPRIRDVVDSLRPQARDRQLTLEADLPAGELEVWVDGPRYERVLMNLLHNAIKFTPRGGTVRVRVQPEASTLRTEVIDNGAGIAPEDQGRLFQRFSQLANAQPHGGAGLGLSICKALVEAHGGSIGMISAPGSGSTFWFSLPTEA